LKREKQHEQSESHCEENERKSSFRLRGILTIGLKRLKTEHYRQGKEKSANHLLP